MPRFVLAAIVFAALALVAWSRIYDPFAGDQALFLVGAERLHAGGAYYRDFWDLKQPGIYDFFLAAGSVFGFTQIGEHLADMVWQLSFAATLAIALAPAMRDGRLALVAPVFVVGSYYAGSSSWHLMQVEGLVGFPVFCTAWAAIASTRSSKFRTQFLYASGFAAGIVILFKAFLAPVAVAVVASIVLRKSRPGDFRTADWLRWCAGLSTPLVASAIVMAANGTLADALETTFVVPYQIVTTVTHAPFSRLDDSAMRLLLYFRGIILLGLIGAVVARRARSKLWLYACVAWFGAGAVVILAQVESWWQYHFLLLVPPIGILATFGFDYLVDRAKQGGRKTVMALAVGGVVAYVAVPLPQGAIGTLLRVARERPFASLAALERYRIATNSEYAISTEDAALLNAPSDVREPIYVFGEPLIYVISQRRQAISMNGWAPQIDTPALWSRTYAELVEARPRSIFVNVGVSRYLEQSLDGEIERFLETAYDRRGRTRDGTWYALRVIPKRQ